MSWFRVPQWCMAMHDEPSAQRARAWVYLLGAWHSGDDPSTRELRRVTGFGGPRADALVAAVAAWALENGATVPERVVSAVAREVAGQQRGTSGAEAGHPEPDETPAIERERGTSGALPGQERGARARVPFSEREKRGEEITERAPEAPPLPTDEDLYAPLTLLLLPAPEAPQGAPTPATHATAFVEPAGAKGGASGRGKRGVAAPSPTLDLWGTYRALRTALPPLAAPAPAGRAAVARVAERPSPDATKALTRILAECGDLDRARLYLEWVHTSGDTEARRLRGEAPWPDGAPFVRLDVESLARHIPARLDVADAWDARGRTEPIRAVARAAERAPSPVAPPGSDRQPWEGAIAYSDRCVDEWRAGIRAENPRRAAR